MRILLIKLTSLGDVVHTLPALTDALAAIPDLRVDWMIEESYADLVSQHPAVENVIPIPYRTIRKKGFGMLPAAISQWRILRRQLWDQKYDRIIESQGLLKSANLVFLNPAPTAGFDFKSAREPLASLFYNDKFRVSTDLHAVERQRLLFAKALNYSINEIPARTALSTSKWQADARLLLAEHNLPDNYMMFLHGTAWKTKIWPESRWRLLAENFNDKAIKVLVPWGNEDEKNLAHRISENLTHIHVLPKFSVVEVSKIITMAKTVIAGDTGLGHIAAAFDIPGLMLLGPTSPELIGHSGSKQRMIVSSYPLAPCYRRKCADADDEKCCMAAISVEQVSSAALDMLAAYDTA